MPDIEFEYFEIRPCIDLNGAFVSYLTEEAFDEDRQRLDAKSTAYKATWTLYGRHTDGNGICAALVIGDFNTKDDAFTIMNAILAPMAKARDLAREPEFPIKPGVQISPAERAAYTLDDVINQSSDRERL